MNSVLPACSAPATNSTRSPSSPLSGCAIVDKPLAISPQAIAGPHTSTMSRPCLVSWSGAKTPNDGFARLRFAATSALTGASPAAPGVGPSRLKSPGATRREARNTDVKEGPTAWPGDGRLPRQHLQHPQQQRVTAPSARPSLSSKSSHSASTRTNATPTQRNTTPMTPQSVAITAAHGMADSAGVRYSRSADGCGGWQDPPRRAAPRP